MALPSAPNSISLSQIRYEFGPRANQARLGDYRVNQNIGTLQNLPLDTDIPKSGPIKFSDFYNKRLNVVVDYFSGASPVYRSTARADFDSQNVVVVGNPTSRLDVGSATTTSSGRRVIVNVNKTIGSQKSTVTPYVCALRTGNGWESDTDLEFEIGTSGIIAGSGGDGGDGGFEISGRTVVSFVNSFGGAEVETISLSGAVNDLVILVSASSTVFVGDTTPPSGYAEIDANKSGPNGNPLLPYYKLSYKRMESSSENITGLTTSNCIHVASIFRGFAGFSGNIGRVDSSTGTTVTFPTVSVDASSLVFVYGIAKDDNILPITSSGYTGIRSIDLGSGNDVVPGGTLIVGYKLATSSGSVSPGSFTSSSWNGDGWVSGSVPLGGASSGTSDVNGKPGTSALGIQYPCTINNAGLIIAGGGGGGAGARGRRETNARTQDGCEGFGGYFYAGGGGGGGGRGLPGGTGGLSDPDTTARDQWFPAQTGFDGDVNSFGSGGGGGFVNNGGDCPKPTSGGSGGSGGTAVTSSQLGNLAPSPADSVTPRGSFGINGFAIVVNGGVPYTPPTGNLPIGGIVTATVS